MVASKSVRSKLWFVRLDGPEEHLRLKCGDLSRSLDTVAMLAAFHKGKSGENPHCHICIEIQSDIQKQSFADRLKKMFGITERSQYALEVWDGNRGKGAVSYLFHEVDAPVLVAKGFTEEDLLRAREANDAVQAVVAINKEKASVKLVEKAKEHFKGSVYRSELKREILKWMLVECKEGRSYYPGSFLIKKYVEEVELSCVDLEEMDLFADRVYGQLWRD